MTLISQAEYARRLGVTRASISQWKKSGKLVLQGEQVDVEASDARLKRYRRGGLPGVDPSPTVVKRGRPDVKQADELNTEPVCLTCAEVAERLAALDWKQTFQWDAASQHERVQRAAECVGFVAATSEIRDDGHWGGYQLRIPPSDGPKILLDINGIAAGFGFELSEWEAIDECRDELKPIDDDDPNETVMVRMDLLHFLARPYTEKDKPRGLPQIDNAGEGLGQRPGN
jgi:DNA-binding transcriptional regulator YdaS (Cro superfamily)